MFCMKCGTQLPDDALFCIKCGCNLSALKSNTNSNSVTVVSNENISNPTPLTSISTLPQNNNSATIYAPMVADKNRFPQLSNSLEKFLKLYNQYLFDQRDMFTAMLLYYEYCTKYGQLKDEDDPKWQAFLPAFCVANSIDEKGLGKSISDYLLPTWTDEDFKGDFNEYCENITSFVSFAFWSNCFMYRYFLMEAEGQKANDKFIEKISSLEENGSSEDADRLKSNFEYEYGMKYGFPAYIKIIENALDLEHIQNDFNKYAECYSYFVSDIYEYVLNNAIKIHNARYLEKLRPTSAQKEKFALLVQNKLKNGWIKFSSQLNLLIRSGYNIDNKCKQIDSLGETFSGGSLVKDGVECFAMGLLTGGLGLLNAGRKMYNYYEVDDKIGKLNNELSDEFDKYCSMVDELCNITVDTAIKLNDDLGVVTKTALYPALSNLFSTLQKNGEAIKPLSYYIR